MVFPSVFHTIESYSALGVKKLTLQFRGLSMFSSEAKQPELMKKNQLQLPEDFIFSISVFLLEGKIKQARSHEMALFCFFCSLAALLTTLERGLQFQKLTYFNWFISFNSNCVLLYCFISHSATVFSKPSCFFCSFLIQACFPAFSLSFLPTPQDMDPCMPLPRCHRNHA